MPSSTGKKVLSSYHCHYYSSLCCVFIYLLQAIDYSCDANNGPVEGKILLTLGIVGFFTNHVPTKRYLSRIYDNLHTHIRGLADNIGELTWCTEETRQCLHRMGNILNTRRDIRNISFRNMQWDEHTQIFPRDIEELTKPADEYSEDAVELFQQPGHWNVIYQTLISMYMMHAGMYMVMEEDINNTVMYSFIIHLST